MFLCATSKLHIYIIKYHILGPEYREELVKIIFSLSHSNDSASFQKKKKKKKIIMTLGNWPLNVSKLHKDGPKGSGWQMLVPSNTREGSSGFGLVSSGLNLRQASKI